MTAGAGEARHTRPTQPARRVACRVPVTHCSCRSAGDPTRPCRTSRSTAVAPPRQARPARSPSSLDGWRRAPRGVLICNAPAAHPHTRQAGGRGSSGRARQPSTGRFRPHPRYPVGNTAAGSCSRIGRAARNHNRLASTPILKSDFCMDTSSMSRPRFDQLRRVPELGYRRLGPNRVGPSKSVSRLSRPVAPPRRLLHVVSLGGHAAGRVNSGRVATSAVRPRCPGEYVEVVKTGF